MPMYNLVKYSDNYSDASESLWGFKRDEINTDSNECTGSSSSFKYKLNIAVIQRHMEQKIE